MDNWLVEYHILQLLPTTSKHLLVYTELLFLLLFVCVCVCVCVCLNRNALAPASLKDSVMGCFELLGACTYDLGNTSTTHLLLIYQTPLSVEPHQNSFNMATFVNLVLIKSKAQVMCVGMTAYR